MMSESDFEESRSFTFARYYVEYTSSLIFLSFLRTLVLYETSCLKRPFKQNESKQSNTNFTILVNNYRG